MVKLYSTGCPKCKIIKTKLDKANIEYEIISDMNIMLNKGFKSVPMLEVDNKVLNFNEIVSWLSEVNKENK